MMEWATVPFMLLRFLFVIVRDETEGLYIGYLIESRSRRSRMRLAARILNVLGVVFSNLVGALAVSAVLAGLVWLTVLAFKSLFSALTGDS